MRVLFLDLDTLRNDHLGCYGYCRNTSPNIDRVAAEGVVFTNYYCSNAPCLPSRSALMSGRFGFHSGVVGHGGTAADPFVQGPDRNFFSGYDLTCLPSLFRQCGFHTAAVSSFGERHGAFWFYGGFNEVYNTGKRGNETADEVAQIALKWLDENAEKDNWYLHVNFWDAHTIYRTPEEYGNPFENVPTGTWIDDQILAEHKKMVGCHKPLEPGGFNDKIGHGGGEDLSAMFPRAAGKIEDMNGVKKMMDGYDCGIRYMDDYIGKLFDRLKEKGVWDDLCVIITADHGEDLGELGVYSEHGTADESICHIPMIIKWKNCGEGIKESGLHYNLDLLPTLADLMGREKPAIWDGKSYADALKGKPGTGRNYLVLEQSAHVCQRSVRFDHYLYIRTYHDGFHLFDRDMLFDVRNDPHEQHNLACERPDLVQKAASLLLDWLDDMMKTQDNKPDPMWTVMKEGGPLHARGRLKDYIEYLKQTHRDYAIPKLIQRHPEEFGPLPSRYPDIPKFVVRKK